MLTICVRLIFWTTSLRMFAVHTEPHFSPIHSHNSVPQTYFYVCEWLNNQCTHACICTHMQESVCVDTTSCISQNAYLLAHLKIFIYAHMLLAETHFEFHSFLSLLAHKDSSIVTLCFQDDPEAFPFGALSMALMSTWATLYFAVPVLRCVPSHLIHPSAVQFPYCTPFL
jgi:hypothetical protein